MKRAYCRECKRFPYEVCVFPDGYGLGMMMCGDGTLTGAWEDGTAGLTNIDRDAGNAEEAAYCFADHGSMDSPYEVDWLEDKRCQSCNGTGVVTTYDSVMETEDYCDECLMSGTDGETGHCPNCGNTVRWNDGAELFEACWFCGFTDPFVWEVTK